MSNRQLSSKITLFCRSLTKVKKNCSSTLKVGLIVSKGSAPSTYVTQDIKTSHLDRKIDLYIIAFLEQAWV